MGGRIVIALLLPAFLFVAGCQQLQRALYCQPRLDRHEHPAARQPVILASYQTSPRTTQSVASPTKQEPRTDAVDDQERANDQFQVESPESTAAKNETKASRPAYTAPRLPFQQLAVAVTASVLTSVSEDDTEIGSELAESVAFSSSGPIGRLGLTAPPTQLAGRITSRRGLQEGPATGLVLTGRLGNIFTLGSNRAGGPNGRCRELARSGFFGGDQRACVQSLHR